jgi:N-methylhydantoinase B
MQDDSYRSVTVEIVKNELAASVEEIALTVSRTGRSHMVRLGDFAAAIFDAEGELLAQSAASFQVGQFHVVIDEVRRRWGNDLAPGDILLTNDPWGGMGHLPDIAVIGPCFHEGALIAFCIIYSHHTDIGGRFVGGFSNQTGSIYEEGLRLPCVKLYDRGVRVESLIQVISANVRGADIWMGDLEAKIAGLWRGDREIASIIRKHGVELIAATSAYLKRYSEVAVRQALEAIPDGEYTYRGVFDDGDSADPLDIVVTLNVEDDNLRLSFDGTSPQVDHGINVPYGMTYGMTLAALRALVGADVHLNRGFALPMTIVIPPGCFLNPVMPAPVAGRAPVAFRLSDTVFRALALAAPERSLIPGEGGDLIHFSGVTPDGAAFLGMDSFSSGWGARPGLDGVDGMSPITFGSMTTTPAEVLEREFPIVLEGFGFVPDTSGAGEFRGSAALCRRWRFLAPAEVMVRTNHLRPNLGMDGGGDGLQAGTWLISDGERRDLPRNTHVHVSVKAGDRIEHATCGAGGYGDPIRRDPELVRADVLADKLSKEAALAEYGVVLVGNDLHVDEAATIDARNTLANGRHT